MMRNKVSSALQKTYDECYLICSTAVYFEGQGNEAEALRSWRSALDQIYYHNAYKVPPGYIPKSETEKSLKDSLKDMEIRCKERVDLLQALKQSREEENKQDGMSTDDSSKQRKSSRSKHKLPTSPLPQGERGFLGDGTVPAMDYPDLQRARPPSLPTRPRYDSKTSSDYAVVGLKKTSSPPRLSLDLRPSGPKASSSSTSLQLPQVTKSSSRSPSPEKRTMLHTLRNPEKAGKKSSRSPRVSTSKKEDFITNKAASMAWQSTNVSGNGSVRDRLGRSLDTTVNNSSTTLSDGSRKPSSGDPLSRPVVQNVRYDSMTRTLVPDTRNSDSRQSNREDDIMAWRDTASGTGLSRHRPQTRDSAKDGGARHSTTNSLTMPDPADFSPLTRPSADSMDTTISGEAKARMAPPPPPHGKPKFTPVGYPVYLNEYPETTAKKSDAEHAAPLKPAASSGEDARVKPEVPQRLPRKPVSANISSPRQREQPSRRRPDNQQASDEGESSPDLREPFAAAAPTSKRPTKQLESAILAEPMTPTSDESNTSERMLSAWEVKAAALLKNLPKGVDEGAAKQILNEIVVQGDEVHWDDVAGLGIAKKALKEAVVYPFLRPDLFMGLREPARGMLLFGPPGTGKTMLARAVATESRSTFFSISASSLTSKFLGDSEKLVRALFLLAKALAPSIIFVDEIDSLLSTRSSSGEHEATRRIKTEFLIQWSDLQRAAAGREQTDKEKERGDASRVLVLAATNLPWAIDEAARRRFVRRQYIPLPEDETRAVQLRTLLGHQKHSLNERDILTLVQLTDGFSGSDITALAKDAAMGPLRSLGEKLLEMTMDEIRPIQFIDFEASLVNIRPSVSKQGLKEFEDWAREFGERGG